EAPQPPYSRVREARTRPIRPCTKVCINSLRTIAFLWRRIAPCKALAAADIELFSLRRHFDDLQILNERSELRSLALRLIRRENADHHRRQIAEEEARADREFACRTPIQWHFVNERPRYARR